MRKDLERRMEDENKIEEDEEQEEKTDCSNMLGFVGELFKTFQKDVSCMRYALDVMMLEVGSFPNSKSREEAKKAVDEVWTP